MAKKDDIDWSGIGDLICEILTVSLKSRRNLEQEAKRMNGTFEGLVAAAITQRLSEVVQRKKTKSKATVRKSAGETEAEQFQWMRGAFAAAYVLDTVGMLNPNAKATLNSLQFPGVARWDLAVEQDFGINRTFVRSVYSLCTELKEPVDGVVFILQGIGSPNVADRLAELLH